MPSLTSCYFCGDAVGASLDEYDLPEDAPPDDQVTVTLCAGCYGKLSELFDEIDPAAGGDEQSAEPTTTVDFSDVGPSSESDDEATAEDPTLDVEPPAAVDDSELDPVAGDREPIFADDGDAVLDEELPEEAESEAPFGSGDDSADGADRAESQEEAADGEPVDTESEDSPPTDGSEEVSAASDSVDTTDTDDSEADHDASTVDVNAGGTGASAQQTQPEESGSSGDGPLADVSPRTYNRVVRLLQNREFPVDRADFEALATSAYELDHGECTAALDGAIEKGLLEERDGMLHRPE